MRSKSARSSPTVPELKQKRDAERRRILQKAGWWVIEATDEHLVSALAFAPIIADLLALIHRAA